MLPPRIQKAAKRDGRFKSQKHRDFVRSHACCNCGSTTNIQVAHVRLGSGAGMGRKPDDFRTVSLCHACHHGDQHTRGEETFWAGKDVEGLMDAFAKESPVAKEIAAWKREHGHGA